MAHFALLNEENIVVNVIVIDNSLLDNKDFPESEPLGQEYIVNILDLQGIWLQTSYNKNFRTNYGQTDFFYDEENDEFLPPQPYPSWTLNETKDNWEPPYVPETDSLELPIYWNEDTQEWLSVN